MRNLRVLMLVLAAACSKTSPPPPASGSAAPAAATKPATAAAPVEPPAVPAPVPGGAVDVTAEKLWADYKSDDISADDKYRNRTLKVSGKIGSVEQDAFGNKSPGMVHFRAKAGDGQDVQAFVDPKVSATLKVDQSVVMLCTGSGFEMEMALLKDCTIAK